MAKNLFDIILNDFGFSKKRQGTSSVRHYYHREKNMHSYIDESKRRVEVYVEDDLVVQGIGYRGYSIKGLTSYLKNNGFESKGFSCG